MQVYKYAHCVYEPVHGLYSPGVTVPLLNNTMGQSMQISSRFRGSSNLTSIVSNCIPVIEMMKLAMAILSVNDGISILHIRIKLLPFFILNFVINTVKKTTQKEELRKGTNRCTK